MKKYDPAQLDGQSLQRIAEALEQIARALNPEAEESEAYNSGSDFIRNALADAKAEK